MLDVFAQRGILPKYGFPVDVVELDVSRSGEGSHLELTRDLRLGILEYAPGAKVVAAGRLWKSVGVRQMSGRLLPQWGWAVCDGCGVLRTQFAVPGEPNAELFREPCEHCGTSEFRQRGRFVTPMYGFLGEQAGERPGESRPPRDGTLRTYFAEFDGPPPIAETVELGGTPIPTRTSRKRWITVFNRGRSTRGFQYCGSCGYSTDQLKSQRARGGQPPKHDRPLREQSECHGRLMTVDLGHRFLTNVVELELPVWRTRWDVDVAALSSLYALIAAAPDPGIGVSQSDIGGSLTVGPGGRRRVVIYDDVPGGAGHARYLRECLDDLVVAALARVKSCSCGVDTSCYGCLRSYRNQFEHDDLVRGAAIEVLTAVLGPQ